MVIQTSRVEDLAVEHVVDDTAVDLVGLPRDGNVVYPDGGLDLGLVLPLFESTSMAFWQEEGVTIDGVYDDHGEKHKVRLTLRARAPEGTPPLTRVKPDGSFTELEPLAAKN